MRAIVICLLLLLTGCGPFIRGVANTHSENNISYKGATFSLEAPVDSAESAKVGTLVARALELQGMVFSSANPSLRVRYAFDVVPEGSVSSAYSWVSGSGRWANVNTSVTSVRTFRKLVALGIYDESGKLLWSGEASETGWCNQIIVTAPHVLSLLLTDFPTPLTNLRKTLGEGDDYAQSIRDVLGGDVDWGCTPVS